MEQRRTQLTRFGVFDASHLVFLPSIMASLTFLESLQFAEGMLIQSLPELPSSLRALQIFGCQESKGHDWHKIAHIPYLRIEQDSASQCKVAAASTHRQFITTKRNLDGCFSGV
uniref:NB-ARC domain-containing protein n=1 Tax=Oryza nivara TaxID=4536 RepID=A0A0E0IJ99_ORYNI